MTQYGITAPNHQNGNYHISEVETLTPICGTKTKQRDTAMFKPDTIEATFTAITDRSIERWACNKCRDRAVKMMRAS